VEAPSFQGGLESLVPRGEILRNLLEGAGCEPSGYLVEDDKLELIRERLLELARTLGYHYLFPAKVPEAQDLVLSDPYAFILAVCLNRGVPGDVIWTIPWDIKRRLGHLDPLRLGDMTLRELAQLFEALPRRPRFVNAAPQTVHEVTQKVIKEAGGDARKLWMGKSADEIKKNLRSIFGVGRGIANLAVLLIEKAYGPQFDDRDRRGMDIKPDINVKRVLFRMGVASDDSAQAAIDAARMLNPSFPGEIDGPLWYIGRTWCHKHDPDCANCPIEDFCPKICISK
jgi:endonuclease III